MIEKSRLQELIKEGATIYTIKHIGVDVMELSLKNISDDFWYFLLGMTEELFEDKAEVEEKAKKIKWALKYHATRTEELDLPMWEEPKADQITTFMCKDHREARLYVSKFYNCVCVEIGDWTEFREEYSKENYEKACDLCLKLFKGKKNENNMHTRR